MPDEHKISFGGEELLLRGDRSLFWPSQKALLIADLHAGKAEHMRRAGMAIPSGSLEDDLERLSLALLQTSAQYMYILGDLFHSDINAEWEIFAAWTRRQPCEVALVRGNHDRFLSGADLGAATLAELNEPYQLGDIYLRHHPPTFKNSRSVEYFTIAGHLHPAVTLYGPGHDKLRLPCFWLKDQLLVLPSFGSFTGGYDIRRAMGGTTFGCSKSGDLISIN